MTIETYQPASGYVIPEDKIEVVKNGNEMVVRYDIEAVEKTEESEQQQYRAYNVRLTRSAEYGDIVSAIVEDKYPNDCMQAVINNYLVSPTEGDHTEAFNEMQEWRAHAKVVAKAALAK